jgi:hypothetical protein
MDRKYLVFLFTFFIKLYSSFSQTFTAVPSWIIAENVQENSEVDTKNIKAGYYFVLADEQFNTVLKQNYYHYATKAVSNIGLDYTSQIEITYEPSFQKVQIHFIRIYRGKNVIDRTHTSGIKLLKEEADRDNGILNDNSTLYANLSDIQNGDIVEYAYSIIGYNKIFNNYFGYNFGFGYSVPVGRVARRVIIDKNTELSILNKNIEIKPEISEGKYLTYFWAINNCATIKLEDNTPAWYDPFPQVQISNCKDWKEVKKWSKSLFLIKEYDKSKLQILADSVKNKYSNLEEQISALIDFTQNQIRYLSNTGGVYSHQPHLPDYVAQKRYGDCKDKTLFLHELLKLINVKSYPVLLNTEKRKNIKYNNPSISEFNHCIIAINYQDSLYYIDPTIAFQGGSFKNRKLPNYEVVFPLDENENIFNEITSDTTSRILITEDFKINGETKDAILTVRSNYTGIQADNIRYSFANNSLADMQENYRSFYLTYCSEVEVMDTIAILDNVQINEIEVSEQYLLKHFWSRTDSASTKIEKNFMPYVLNEKILYTKDNIRKQPLSIFFPVSITQNINVYNPNGWDIKKETIEEDNKLFYYFFKTSVNENSLNLNYVYRSKVNQVDAEDYSLYKLKTDFVDNHIVLSVSASDVNDKVFGFNWLLIATSIVSIIFSLILCFQLYKRPYANNHERRYDSIGGWLILVGIGILITPFVLSYGVIKLYSNVININYYYYYFNEASRDYHPLRGYYEILLNFGNIFFIVASVFLIALFLQKRSSFRIYYCAYRIINVVFLIIDLILIYTFVENPISAENRILINTEAAALGKVVFQSCIWVPYIWFSERSKHTFTGDNSIEIDPKN